MLEVEGGLRACETRVDPERANVGWAASGTGEPDLKKFISCRDLYAVRANTIALQQRHFHRNANLFRF